MIVPGTKMTFGGLKDPEQVKEVVRYLESLK
jgi:cytochrome c2